MDFQPVIIVQVRFRQGRGDGNGWYRAVCKTWINRTESYAVAIAPISSGEHGDLDNCAIVCPRCHEWIRLDLENDPHKILKAGDVPYKIIKTTPRMKNQLSRMFIRREHSPIPLHPS